MDVRDPSIQTIPILEYQMEKEVETEMEAGAIRSGLLGSLG